MHNSSRISARSGLLLVLLVVCLCSPSWATWNAVVQHKITAACTLGSTTCNVVLTSTTGSGHVLFAGVASGAVTITLSSVSGAGTWTCPGAGGSDATGAFSTDACYNLSSTSGVTTITLTRSASGSNWSSEVTELSFTGSGATFDNANNVDDSTSATNQPGVALTLSGSNDAIYQVGISGQNFSSINGAYAIQDTGGGGARAFAVAINTAVGTAPTWTLAGSSRLAGSAIAISETAGGGGTGHNPTLMLLGVGL